MERERETDKKRGKREREREERIYIYIEREREKGLRASSRCSRGKIKLNSASVFASSVQRRFCNLGN